MTSKKNVADGALNSNFSGPAGEHLVLGELLKREHSAFLAQGPSQSGWDIIVVDEEHGKRSVKIQVKTIDWPITSAVTVPKKSLCKFDFMVVVLLQRKQCRRSRFLILTPKDVESSLSEHNPDRKDNNRTLNIGKDWEKVDDRIKAKEDKWCQIAWRKCL